MSADTRLEELGGSGLGWSGLGEVDESAFSGLAERHRRELHVHCYRMLGSFEDAEDTVQETFLRAWRRETFEGRSTFRAWLYRIATNACLDLLAKCRPEPATGGEVLWLQPYPDRLLDELPAGDADEPETVAVARETIELAYMVAVQHLAPRPRAVLILRDVLGWPAKDVAKLLGDSVNSVNSALQRARVGMREHLPAERQDWTGGEEDAGTRELVRRYTDASVGLPHPRVHRHRSTGRLLHVEARVVGVVVGDVRGVPELFDPGQERLRAQLLQHSAAGECGDELLVDELPELTRAGPVPAAQVDQDASTGLLPRACDVIPAG
ncbi:RNA polymerase subunit sigma-70 [Streptomyces violaceus]|uniref:RNA polymerase subunit sigma-70 n=1 Tax=Streptomyces violaceus TaxID=1936 RepID=UPI0037F3D8EE